MSCKDKKNTEIVFETFQHISQSYNQALLIVTHDPGFASRTHRIIEMEDGRIVK
jgi:lipoprotein-releasing system ATP-binding protein